MQYDASEGSGIRCESIMITVRKSHSRTDVMLPHFGPQKVLELSEVLEATNAVPVVQAWHEEHCRKHSRAAKKAETVGNLDNPSQSEARAKDGETAQDRSSTPGSTTSSVPTNAHTVMVPPTQTFGATIQPCDGKIAFN
jgi:hypothetical protein